MLELARGAGGQGSCMGAQPGPLFVLLLFTLLCNRRQHVSIKKSINGPDTFNGKCNKYKPSLTGWSDSVLRPARRAPGCVRPGGELKP